MRPTLTMSPKQRKRRGKNVRILILTYSLYCFRLIRDTAGLLFQVKVSLKRWACILIQMLSVRSTKWHRVILDEGCFWALNFYTILTHGLSNSPKHQKQAHEWVVCCVYIWINNDGILTAGASRCVTDLDATYRWCLTGYWFYSASIVTRFADCEHFRTPITNSILDAYSLLRWVYRCIVEGIVDLGCYCSASWKSAHGVSKVVVFSHFDFDLTVCRWLAVLQSPHVGLHPSLWAPRLTLVSVPDMKRNPVRLSSVCSGSFVGLNVDIS